MNNKSFKKISLLAITGITFSCSNEKPNTGNLTSLKNNIQNKEEEINNLVDEIEDKLSKVENATKDDCEKLEKENDDLEKRIKALSGGNLGTEEAVKLFKDSGLSGLANELNDNEIRVIKNILLYYVNASDKLLEVGKKIIGLRNANANFENIKNYKYLVDILDKIETDSSDHIQELAIVINNGVKLSSIKNLGDLHNKATACKEEADIITNLGVDEKTVDILRKRGININQIKDKDTVDLIINGTYSAVDNNTINQLTSAGIDLKQASVYISPDNLKKLADKLKSKEILDTDLKIAVDSGLITDDLDLDDKNTLNGISILCKADPTVQNNFKAYTDMYNIKISDIKNLNDLNIYVDSVETLSEERYKEFYSLYSHKFGLGCLDITLLPKPLIIETNEPDYKGFLDDLINIPEDESKLLSKISQYGIKHTATLVRLKLPTAQVGTYPELNVINTRSRALTKILHILENFNRYTHNDGTSTSFSTLKEVVSFINSDLDNLSGDPDKIFADILLLFFAQFTYV